MTRSTNNVWLHRFACALAAATLFLVALGGVVTTKGVGMAVPDWPTTFGEHMFLFPYSKMLAGVFDEHSHRYVASIVGMLAAVFAVWAWVLGSTGKERWLGIVPMVVVLGLVGVRKPAMFVVMAGLSVVAIIYAVRRAFRDEQRLRWIGVITLAAVIIQGVLGGLRVLLDQHGWGTELGIFHATFAQLFFLLVCSLAFLTSRWWNRAQVSEADSNVAPGVRRFFAATTLLILVQLVLGATMRHQHAGLAVPDFPLAYGKVWPATDAASLHAYNAHRVETTESAAITAPQIVLHMLHRFTAYAVLLAIIGCAVAAWRNTARGSLLRKVSALWLAVALVQVALGILTILSQRKVDVTTAHVAVGAVTFMLGWLLVLIASRSVAEKVCERADSAVRAPLEVEHA